MSAGRCTCWIACAMVKVLPEPVTPSRTWSRSPARIPATMSAMACGWSPAGWKSDMSWNGRPVSGATGTARSTTMGSDCSGFMPLYIVRRSFSAKTRAPPAATLLTDSGRVGSPLSWIAASSIAAPEHVHQLGDFRALLLGIAAGDRVLDAMPDVVLQHQLLDPAQGRPHCCDLGHNIYAIAVLLHHLGEAADLAFDTVE